MRSVIDMGSQEIMFSMDRLEQMVVAAGMPGLDKGAFANLANFPSRPYCSATPFYEMLGFEEYACVEMNGQHGALPIDLNFPLEDTALYGRYDLLTDYGTNEHVFNIAEAYRTMHRLCKPQGIMVIQQQVYGGNGYWNMDLSFLSRWRPRTTTGSCSPPS